MFQAWTRIETVVWSGPEGACWPAVRSAISALCSAAAAVREVWEPETTARDRRLILEARERRGEPLRWAEKIEEELSRARP